MGAGAVARAADGAQVLALDHRLADGLGGRRAVLHVAVPGDGPVGVLDVDGVPGAATETTAAVVVAVVLLDDDARSRGHDLHGAVVHEVPVEGPEEEVGALVVVTLGQVVAAGAAVPVPELVGVGGVVVDEARDAVHAGVGHPVGRAQRPGQGHLAGAVGLGQQAAAGEVGTAGREVGLDGLALGVGEAGFGRPDHRAVGRGHRRVDRGRRRRSGVDHLEGHRGQGEQDQAGQDEA